MYALEKRVLYYVTKHEGEDVLTKGIKDNFACVANMCFGEISDNIRPHAWRYKCPQELTRSN